MRVTSPAFEEGEIIPAHWCAPASDTLPRLEIVDVPPEAASLVVILEDPESPLGTVTHWLVWNIPPTTRYLDPQDLPAGARVGMDTYGQTGEMGPPPPAGRRHYRWEILALDIVLDLPAGASRVHLDRALQGHVIERGRLTAVVEHPESGDARGE
ncbi:MAG: YbhB/YbcL family Raf kinase inhibitor-like protein [Halofilum sp. (in: g-proteobacteria)]